MKNTSVMTKKALRWVPLTLVFLAFIYSVTLKSGIPTLKEESTEVVKTSTYLDSPASLKTLITSLDRRVQYVVAETEYAMGVMLFALFFTSAVAVAFWFMYLSAAKKAEQKTTKVDH